MNLNNKKDNINFSADLNKIPNMQYIGNTKNLNFILLKKYCSKKNHQKKNALVD